MTILKRLQYETIEAENKLEGVYQDQHQAVVQKHLNGSFFSLSRHMRRMSAMIWNREQEKHQATSPERWADPEKVQSEILEEARAIVSDYGTLSLSGLRLLMVVMAIWLLLQIVVNLQLNLVTLLAIILICTVIYPIAVYRFWNNRSVHPFKDMKLILGMLGALALGAGVYFLSRTGTLTLLLQGGIQVRFDLTGFLILFNTAVILSFIIHYRRMNQFTDLYNEYEERLISLSVLTAGQQDGVGKILKALEPIPLKTHTKRSLKRLLIREFQRAGAVPDVWVRGFIRGNCIDMNWIYWSGTVVQWTFIILLVSKLVWALDSGLMVSADYFRQELTTGMAFGALFICGAVICPLNRGFRELLYQGASFSLKHAWLLICLISLCVSLTLFSGLVPSRFIWGYPLNPAPNPWGFLLLMVLIATIQFIKNDSRFADQHENKKQENT